MQSRGSGGFVLDDGRKFDCMLPSVNRILSYNADRIWKNSYERLNTISS